MFFLQQVYAFIRVFLGVAILGAIMGKHWYKMTSGWIIWDVTMALYICTVTNFGQEWEVASIYTKTQYRAGLKEEIHAHIGAKIGLRSINITLKGWINPFFSSVLTQTFINFKWLDSALQGIQSSWNSTEEGWMRPSTIMSGSLGMTLVFLWEELASVHLVRLFF